MELGFWIPVVIGRIPDSLSCISDFTSKVFFRIFWHKQTFPGMRNRDSLALGGIQDLTLPVSSFHRCVYPYVRHRAIGRHHQGHSPKRKSPLLVLPLELLNRGHSGVILSRSHHLVDWLCNSSRRIPVNDAGGQCRKTLVHDHVVFRKLYIIGNPFCFCPKFLIFSSKRQCWSFAQCIFTDAY